MRTVRLTALAVLLLAACDDLGPHGPTEVLGTVTGSATLGAAVIDFTWPGVTGVEGRGGSRVYAGPVSDSPNRHRVILLDATGGDLLFSIEFDHARFDGPRLTLVSAVGTDNLPIDVSELRVVLER